MTDRRAVAINALRAERDDHYAEIRRIDDALVALGALTARDQNTAPRTDERMTLQGRIKLLMEEQDKEWTAAAVVDALQAEGFVGLKHDDPVPGVRTSFVRLKGKGVIANVGTGKGRYKATKWSAYDPFELDDSEMSELDLKAMLAEDEATSRPFEREYNPAEEPF